MKVKLALQTLEKSVPEIDATEFERIKLERSFNTQAATKPTVQAKQNGLKATIAVCLIASLISLQVEYGFLKSVFILASLVMSVSGIAWSVKELRKILMGSY